MSKRRAYKPLTSMTGTPCFDQYKRGRQSQKRPFTQLTLGGGVEPIPALGRMYRYLKVSSIADYESVATGSWISGTTGGDNWNCLYFHHEVASASQESFEFILNPLRHEVDAPASNGGAFDWFTQSGPALGGTKIADGRYGLTNAAGPGINTYEIGTMAILPEMLSSNSHAAFTDDRIRWLNTLKSSAPFIPVRPTRPRGSLTYYETTLGGLSASGTYDISDLVTVEMAYLQHYKNGAKLGTFIDLSDTTVAWWWIDPISPGDTYAFDVWWRIKYTPITTLGSRAARCTRYVPTTRVSDSSRRYVDENGKSWVPFHAFSNVNHTPDFNYQQQTYSMTFSGHSGWTIHNGSNTVQFRNQTGASAQVSPRNATLSFEASSPTYAWLRQIFMYWDRELVTIVLRPGINLLEAMGFVDESEFVLGVQYRPTDSSDHRESVTSKDFGFINVAAAGVFNQGGTTTFTLIDWSATFESAFPAGVYNNEAGGLISATPDSAVPTSISVSRVNL